MRWSTIEKEAFSIYWALKKLDDLLGGITFTIRMDPQFSASKPSTQRRYYLGVEKQADDRDTATGGQDDAHGRNPAVTEDA